MSVRQCFVDYTKAFGCVNYWQLFKQLLEDGINAKLVRLLAYWFDKQEIFILWNGVRSCVVMEPNRVESYLYIFLLDTFPCCCLLLCPVIMDAILAISVKKTLKFNK